MRPARSPSRSPSHSRRRARRSPLASSPSALPSHRSSADSTMPSTPSRDSSLRSLSGTLAPSLASDSTPRWAGGQHSASSPQHRSPRRQHAGVRRWSLALLVAVAAACPSPAGGAEPGVMQATSADGRRTVTASALRGTITLDGALDEEAWRLAERASDFVQAEPHEGQPATEHTEVRLVFDSDALYVGVVCRD